MSLSTCNDAGDRAFSPSTLISGSTATNANPAHWVPVVKNTFIDVHDSSERDSRRKLKPFHSCGDDMLDPITPKIFKVEAVPGGDRHDSQAPACDAEMRDDPRGLLEPVWVPRIRNTFVDVFDAAERDGRRQLKPFLSCGDMPDPTLRVNPCDSVVDGEVHAYTGVSCSGRKRSRSPSDALSHSRRIKHQDQVSHKMREPLFYKWEVDARKMQSKDKHIVLPVFTSSLGMEEVMLRLIITAQSESKRNTCFLKSVGWGSLQIKCQTSLQGPVPKFTCRAWVGNDAVWQSSPAFVSHDFAENPICELPGSSGLWDFNAAVNQTTSTFKVCLEVTPYIDKSPGFDTPEKEERCPEAPVNAVAPMPTPEKLPLARTLSFGSRSPDAMFSKMLDDDWSISSSSDSDDDSDDE